MKDEYYLSIDPSRVVSGQLRQREFLLAAFGWYPIYRSHGFPAIEGEIIILYVKSGTHDTHSFI